ncbi:MAG: helix-hairpin-helix domain-containing protein [Actinomycetia bacterium]|nr:helix-hairpin-helix domain-containing protein [Actinomycetes bacterium]
MKHRTPSLTGPEPGEDPDTVSPDFASENDAGDRWPRQPDVVVLLLIGGCAVLLAGFWWWSGQPDPKGATTTDVPEFDARDQPGPSPLPPESQPTAATVQDSAALVRAQREPPSPSGTVVVDVRGAVRQRGIHSLPAGSRVVDAISAAGGLRKSGTYGDINLAAPVQDGEQIRIGRRGSSSDQQVSATGSSGDAQQLAATPVSLNSATAETLQTLPGVGPVLAQRIADWRAEHGPFSAVEELLGVSGIGEKVLAGMQDQISL